MRMHSFSANKKHVIFSCTLLNLLTILLFRFSSSLILRSCHLSLVFLLFLSEKREARLKGSLFCSLALESTLIYWETYSSKLCNFPSYRSGINHTVVSLLNKGQLHGLSYFCCLCKYALSWGNSLKIAFFLLFISSMLRNLTGGTVMIKDIRETEDGRWVVMKTGQEPQGFQKCNNYNRSQGNGFLVITDNISGNK